MCHLSVPVVTAHAAFGATTLVLMLLAAIRSSRPLAALRETWSSSRRMRCTGWRTASASSPCGDVRRARHASRSRSGAYNAPPRNRRPTKAPGPGNTINIHPQTNRTYVLRGMVLHACNRHMFGKHRKGITHYCWLCWRRDGHSPGKHQLTATTRPYRWCRCPVGGAIESLTCVYRSSISLHSWSWSRQPSCGASRTTSRARTWTSTSSPTPSTTTACSGVSEALARACRATQRARGTVQSAVAAMSRSCRWSPGRANSAAPVSVRYSPVRSLNVPPASWTMGISGAMSQGPAPRRRKASS